MVLTGRRIWLLASTGKDGVSNLRDTVQAGDAAAHVVSVAPSKGLKWIEMAEHLRLLQVGCVCFSGCKEYQSAAAFAADSGSHCVPAESIYAFNEGEAAQLNCPAIMPSQNVPDAAVGDQRKAFGWQVLSVQALKDARPLPDMTRIHRSLFSMPGMPTCLHPDTESSERE